MADDTNDGAAKDQPTEPTTAPAGETKRRRRRWPWILLLFVFILPGALVALWSWITLSYSYSEGERAGYVQKFSKKGWLCKTWEGEIAMASMPGTMPEVFSFSVRNEGVAQELLKTMGQRVAITYEQHKGVPTSCFGETDYFVTKVRKADQP
jgi:hypothetical protein